MVPSAKGKNVSKLRGRPPKGAKPLLQIRIPPEIRAYLESEAPNVTGGMTSVVISAIELERDIALKLAAETDRIEEFGAAHNLATYKDLADILSRLIRRGLDSYDREKKQKNR